MNILEKLGRFLKQEYYSGYNLLGVVWDKVNEIIENVNNNFTEVTNKFNTKTDLNGDHKGTWQGLRPSQTSEATTSILESHETRLNDHDSQLAEHETRLNDHDSQLAEHETRLNDHDSQLAEKANKDEVTNVMTPKGNIAYASLPITGNEVGDYYYCPDGDGTHGAGNYVWNGASWFFGGTGDEGYNLLKKDIDDIVTKHNNYLLSLTRTTGKFYAHLSTAILTAGENVHTEIYDEIPIKAGITYYYRNFYAYFCNIVYNDGTIVALSETTNAYESGSFTAEKDGKIRITVSLSNPTQYFMFTDDEKVNNYYYNFQENIYEPEGLRSLFIEPVPVQKSNYRDILPDCDSAKSGRVYRLIFSKNETEIPKNTPFGNSYAVTCVCLFMCFGKLNTGVSVGDYQLFFSDGTIYRRQYSAKLSSDGTTYEYYWGDWIIVAQRNEKADNVPRVIVVDKNGNGDYTSLLEGILYATESMYSTVYVRAGDYDLVSEFEGYYGSDFFANYSSSDVKGIILKNRVSVIFDTMAHVTFNYTGDNDNVKSLFSPFNSGIYGFILDNLHLEASNCRYVVHDERGSNTDGYKNVYRNCSMYLDNSGNTGWGSKQCIGGGLGTNGDILVENCIFESVGILDTGYGIVSLHNSAAGDAKSNIVITGNYFKGKGTFRLSWYGNSTDITTALVSNNSFGSAIQSIAETSDGTSPNVNTEIIEWNNVIRTD